MKLLKRVLFALMAAAMLLSLAACGVSESEKIAELSGVWTMRRDDTAEQAQMLLENIDFYAEEIALVDLNSLDEVRQVEFTSDKNYSFSYDVDATKACVREFYTGVFQALYDGRDSINGLYTTPFDGMDQATFNLFYASLYSCTTFEELLDRCVENAYNWDSLAEPFETGTYSVKGDKILCTITGQSQAEALGYSIEENTLTLTYSNATEVYSR